MSSNPATNLNVPNPGVPWFDSEGRPLAFAYQFFAALQQRTGGNVTTSGTSGSVGVTTLVEQISTINSGMVDNVSFALMGLYENTFEPGHAQVSAGFDEIAQAMGVMPDVDVAVAKVTTAVAPGILPLVTGDTPGPVLMSDGFGQCIGVLLS